MRQQVYIQQHFRRGNAASHPDCRAAEVAEERLRYPRNRTTRDGIVTVCNATVADIQAAFRGPGPGSRKRVMVP